MREIKFRAWDNDKKSMFIPHINASFNTGLHDLNIIFEKFGTEYSFMQYSGLKDKNGKEIFEGDVISCPPLFKGDKSYFQITFGEVTVQGLQHWAWLCQSRVLQKSLLDQSIIENGEVIGNVYENPELMQ